VATQPRDAEATAAAVSGASDASVEEAPRRSRRTGTSTAEAAEPVRTRSEAKAGPAETTSKWQQLVNLDRFEGLRKFIRETWAEIKKVIWPDRETTRNLTLVVIAVSVVLGILLGGIDYVLFQLFEALP